MSRLYVLTCVILVASCDAEPEAPSAARSAVGQADSAAFPGMRPPPLYDLDTEYPVGTAKLGPRADGTYPPIRIPYPVSATPPPDYNCTHRDWTTNTVTLTLHDPDTNAPTMTDEERIRRAALDLQDKLEAMICNNTCTFPIEEWDPTDPDRNEGIVVGTADQLDLDAYFVTVDALNREQHVKRSFDDGTHEGVVLVGVNALSVENAVWSFLRGLGHRHFLPTDRWEIVPNVGTTFVTNLDEAHNPADPATAGFNARYLTVGNPQNDNESEEGRCDDFIRWRVQNGYRRGIMAGHTHMWQRIGLDFQNTWSAPYLTETVNPAAVSGRSVTWVQATLGKDASGNPICDTATLADTTVCPKTIWHPNAVLSDEPDCFCRMEYSTQTKFCLDYPGSGGGNSLKTELWKYVQAEYTDPPDLHEGYNTSMGHLGANHTADMLVLSTSDGDSWHPCNAGESGGLRPSDRVVALSNYIDDQIETDTDSPFVADVEPPPWISMLIYGMPTRPPSAGVTVDPDLYLTFTDGFTYEARSVTEVIEAWRAAGHGTTNDIGIYDYFLGYHWQLPGGDLSAAVRRANDVQDWHTLGNVRSLFVERQGGWGQHGLPLYVELELGRKASATATQKISDFFSNAFGANEAAPDQPVRKYFQLIDPTSHAVLLSSDLVAELYDVLSDALANTDPTLYPLRGAERERVLDLLAYTRHLDLHLRRIDGTATEADVYEHAYQTHICEGRWMVDYYVMGADDYPSGHPDQATWVCDSSWTATNAATWIADGTDATRKVLSTCTAGITNCTTYADYTEGTDVSTRFPDGEDLGRPGLFPSTGSGLWSGNQIRSYSAENVAVVTQHDDDAWRMWLSPSQGFHLTLMGGGADGTNPAAYQGNTTLKVTAPGDPTTEYCTLTIPPDRSKRKVLLETGAVSIVSTITTPTLAAQDTADPFVAGGGFEFSGSCTASFTADGFYDLVLENLAPGLDILFERNTAVVGSKVYAARYEAADAPADDQAVSWLTDARWFYVPDALAEGEVILWLGSPECNLYRGGVEPALSLTGGPGFVRVPVQDDLGVDYSGEFWELRLCKQWYLVNVPPYTADDKSEMLLPCTITDPGLAMNTGDCP